MGIIRNVAVRIGGDVSRMARAFRRGQEQAQKFQKKFEDVGSKVTSVGTSLTAGITAPLVGMGTIALNNTIKFEQSMSKVQAVTGATGKSFNELSIKAREMGSKTSKSASEASEAMYYMGLAGWNNKEIMEGIEPVLRLAEAGNLDLARASDLVTDSMSALGLKTKDLDEYLDAMAQTSRRSNTDIDMMAEAMIGVGGQFKNLKTPIAESSAWLGVLANRGIKASEAGTSLNSILINLTSGAGQAGDAMEEIGLSAFDAKGNFKGISVVVKELRDKVKGLNEEKKLEILSKIGGKTQIDTLNALMAGVDEGAGEFDQLHQQIKNADGSLMNMVKTMQGNAMGQLNVLKSSLEELSLQFGEILLPYFKVFVEFIQNMVDKFNLLPENIKKNMVIFGVILAVIPPLILVFGGLLTAITTIAGAVSVLSVPIVAFVGFVAVAIGYIVAWGTAFTVLYKESGVFRESVNKLVEAIKNRFNEMKENIISFKNAFIDFYTNNKETIKKFIDEVGKIFSHVINMVSSFISGDMSNFKLEFFKLIISIIASVGKLAILVVPKIVDMFLAMHKTVRNKVKSFENDVKEKISNAITNALNGLYNITKKAGEKIINGLLDGINKKWESLKTKVSSMTSMIGDFFPKSPAKKGELRNIPKWGYKIMEQLRNSLTGQSPALKKTIDSISKTMTFDHIEVKKSAMNNLIKQFQVIEKNARDTTRKGMEIHKIRVNISELLSEKNAKGTTKERIKEIDQQIKKAKFNIEQLEIEQKNNFVEKFTEDSQKYLEQFNDSLKNSIKNIMSKTQQIFNQYGLFDKVQKQTFSPLKLEHNLKSQVDALKSYQENINLLSKKKISTNMFEYFKEAGLNASDQLRAINKMTDEQLQEYSNLFDEKMKLSEEIAIGQLRLEGKQERYIEKLVFNITGNTITNENDIQRITDAIGYNLKIAGV